MPTGSKSRVVIVGGGFGGVYAARHLDRWVSHDRVEVTLVSRDNYFLMTPLLFEAGSGALDFRHTVNPIRPLLKAVRFVTASVGRVDLAARTVHAETNAGDRYEFPYDHLVLALGQLTDTARIPGSEHALPFKAIPDAVRFYSRVVEAFERANVESDPARRLRELTFVIIGGGLVGVELAGELTDFADRLRRTYTRVDPWDVRVELLQHGPVILPEMRGGLADYADGHLRRNGVRVRVNTGAERIEPGRVFLPGGEVIDAAVVVLAAGLSPSPVIAALDVPKDHGRVKTDACMRVEGHAGVWAVGDCAAIPGPDGKPYPTLAQHAMREAKQLARNLVSALDGKEPQPFAYHTLGTMAALGHRRGVANLMGVKVRGLLAVIVWRAYYLFQMPRWAQRLRILNDWLLAVFFRPDATTINLDELKPAERAPTEHESAVPHEVAG